MTTIEKRSEIENLKYTVSTLVNGLNAVSLSLDDYFLFEDIIYNEQFEVAGAIINGLASISHKDKLALTYIFNHAANDYSH